MTRADLSAAIGDVLGGVELVAPVEMEDLGEVRRRILERVPAGYSVEVVLRGASVEVLAGPDAAAYMRRELAVGP